MFRKSLRYSLERATRNLHSEFGPILTNTDQVLQSYAVNQMKHAYWNEMLHHYLAGPAHLMNAVFLRDSVGF